MSARSRATFGREGSAMRLVARANNSSNPPAFEAAGIETMSPARAAVTILKNMVLRQSLLRGCVVATLKRGDKLVVPNGSTRLEAGDILPLIGGEAAVYAARGKLEGSE